jgi:hypothetical protein
MGAEVNNKRLRNGVDHSRTHGIAKKPMLTKNGAVQSVRSSSALDGLRHPHLPLLYSESVHAKIWAVASKALGNVWKCLSCDEVKLTATRQRHQRCSLSILNLAATSMYTVISSFGRQVFSQDLCFFYSNEHEGTRDRLRAALAARVLVPIA